MTDCQNMILGTGPWTGAGELPSSLPAGSPQTAPDPKADRKHVDETRRFVFAFVFIQCHSLWQLSVLQRKQFGFAKLFYVRLKALLISN